MKKFVNLTPHAIKLNDGTSFPPSGEVASVKQVFTPFNEDVISDSSFEGLVLPPEKEGVIFITSMVVAQAAAAIGRKDVVAPATRHSETVRNDKGHIVSVPGLLRF